MNILVANYDNSNDNVMIFVDDEKFSLSTTTVELALKEAGKSFTDIYEVPDADIRFYLFEPLWADQNFVDGVKDKAARYRTSRTGVYTMDDWRRDGTFKADEGQEVDAEVVEQMRDCVPPVNWGGGLLQVGEAYDHDRTTGAALYTTFEMIGGKWIFRGHKPARRY